MGLQPRLGARPVAGLVDPQAVALQVGRRRPRGPSARRRRRAPGERRSSASRRDSTPRPHPGSIGRGAEFRDRFACCPYAAGVRAYRFRHGCGDRALVRTAPSRRRRRPPRVHPVDGAIAGVVAAGVRRSASASWCAASAAAGPTLDHRRRHAVHRPLRGVAEGPGDPAVRHQRQGRPGDRHRGRLDRPRRRARQGDRATPRGSASPASSGSASSDCGRTSTARSGRPVTGVIAAILAVAAGHRHPVRAAPPAAVGRIAAASTGPVDRASSAPAVPRRRRLRSPCSPPAPPCWASASGAATSSSRPARRRRCPRRPTTVPAADADRARSRDVPGPVDATSRRADDFYRIDTGADDPAGRRRRLDAEDRRHGRPRALVHLRRAGQDGRLRRHRHAAVRLQRRRRQPRRQRHLAGRAPQDVARQGRRPEGGDAGHRAARSTTSRPGSRPRSASTAARRWWPWR